MESITDKQLASLAPISAQLDMILPTFLFYMPMLGKVKPLCVT